jgi:DNA polymerase III subunit gamma/tau
MGYVALYRKYRPLTFEAVAGQEMIVQTIKSAIESNRLSHAYLFCGPRGTGKTTIARLIAKAVNCTGENRPCGVCDSCVAIQEGTHADVIEIDAASNNGVDDVRELIEKVKYAPIMSKNKVYIIDEVHMMSQSAFNALLKTLEDPPEHVLFVLATTEVHKILPTIISRCQRFDFSKVYRDELIDRMNTVMQLEGLTAEDGLINEVALLAEGGMRDALSILDQLYAYCGSELKHEGLNKVYGLLSTQAKCGLLKDIATNDNNKVMNQVALYQEEGIDIRRLTSDLIEILKDCLVFSLTKQSKLLNRLDQLAALDLLQIMSKKKILSLVDILMDTNEKYRNATQAITYFEIALLKMMVASVDTDEAKPGVKPAVSVSATIKPDSEQLLGLLARGSKNTKQAIQMQWNKLGQIVTDVEMARVMIPLSQMQLMAAGQDYLIVHNDDSLLVEQLNLPENELLLTKVTYEIFGDPYRIFAISTKMSQKLVEEFIMLNKQNKLEAAPLFDFDMRQIKKQDPVLELFGEDNVEVV